MSLARLYHVQKTRKEYTCSKCRKPIAKGSPAVSFAVGYRGAEQRRHMDPSCYPKTSERESSMTASIYAAMEDFDVAGLTSLEDLEQAVQDVADAIDEVASEYESNEMYDVNENLQERVDILQSASDELSSWADGLEEEPEESEYTGKEGDLVDDQGTRLFDIAHDDWLERACDAAQSAIDDIELP